MDFHQRRRVDEAPPAMTTERSSDRKQLLIIETDDLIRELIGRWLNEAAYLVAVDDSQASDIALVIVDVPNPAQAAAALRMLSFRYGAPILAMSGRFRRDLAASEDAARRLGVAKILPKPFTCEELLAAVFQCLDSH
jgi:DNA-binding response OmpR family regulator